MACPSTRNLEGWLNDLVRWREICHGWIHQEWENKCTDPVEWKEGDIPGFLPGIVSSPKDLALLHDWKIMNPPPDHTSMEARVGMNIGQLTWKPKRVRLSDAGVIYALLTLPGDYRIRYLPYDFDDRGDVRKERVPKAPTVAFYQNNQRTLVAWKGGYNDAGWLLADNYADEMPCFQAGLVIASSHVKTFDTLNVQLTEYKLRKSFLYDTDFMQNEWEFGYSKFGIFLRGCDDVSGYCLVLAGQNVSGYQKMGLLFGFNVLIGPGADATNPNEAIQQDQLPSRAWTNNQSLDVEFKWQPSDFINFIGINWPHMVTHTIERNTKKATNTCRKRKRSRNGNETRDSLPLSSQSSSAGTETVTERSSNRSIHDSGTSVSFKGLWAELASIESPPRHWELFTAVGTIETMHQSWRHNHVAVKIVQHNISPSEANIVRNLMQTLSPRLSFLILGIDMDKDRIALENALRYNSALVLFQRRVDVLEEGLVKQAYMNFYSYFRTLTLSAPEAPQPLIKSEQQEGSDSWLRMQHPLQDADVQGMEVWPPLDESFPHVMQ
ncbi:unnamed protein product [Penicillium glandicola]